MTTSNVPVTPGSGADIATNSITEDAVTKQLQRFVPNTSAGAEIISTASGSDGSGTITTGGTAQDLFASATPTNGFTVHNPDATEDLWISLSTTALANGQASINVAAGGGSYTTPHGMLPFHSVSIVGATTGHKFTAIKW
jgi:hypothetical protein